MQYVEQTVATDDACIAFCCVVIVLLVAHYSVRNNRKKLRGGVHDASVRMMHTKYLVELQADISLPRIGLMSYRS